MAQYDASTLENVIAAIRKRPWGGVLVVAGYFNNNLATPEGQDWDEGIAAAMAEEVLNDMSGHFLPWYKPWLKDSHTWDMHRGGREVIYRTNYILGTYSRMFQNVEVRDARHNTDDYLVLGCLHIAAPAVHLRYLGRHTRFPVRPQATPDKSECMFSELQRSIPRPS